MRIVSLLFLVIIGFSSAGCIVDEGGGYYHSHHYGYHGYHEGWRS